MKNGSKICARVATSIPTPESLIAIITWGPGCMDWIRVPVQELRHPSSRNRIELSRTLMALVWANFPARGENHPAFGGALRCGVAAFSRRGSALPAPAQARRPAQVRPRAVLIAMVRPDSPRFRCRCFQACLQRSPVDWSPHRIAPSGYRRRLLLRDGAKALSLQSPPLTQLCREFPRMPERTHSHNRKGQNLTHLCTTFRPSRMKRSSGHIGCRGGGGESTPHSRLSRLPGTRTEVHNMRFEHSIPNFPDSWLRISMADARHCCSRQAAVALSRCLTESLVLSAIVLICIGIAGAQEKKPAQPADPTQLSLEE